MKTRLISAGVAVLVLLASGFASEQQFVVAPLVRGSYSNVMVEADFNGDGIPDVGVQGFDTTTRKEVFTVLLGDGDGTFTRSPQVITTQGGQALATGDWDGDGIPDVAIVQGASVSKLYIYVGLGDGTFRQGNEYDFSVVPQAITAGDLNGDGVPDLMTADAVGTVTVFLGQGGGNFGPPTEYSLGNTGEATDITVADFNRDGKLDVAVAQDEELSGSVAVLLGNGDGSLGAAVQYFPGNTVTTHLASGDFNHDGIPDIASGGQYFLGILLGKGDGTFQPAKSYAELRDSAVLRLTDLNGDGNVDVVAVNTTYGPQAVVVFLGNADGSFQPSQLFAPTNLKPISVALADFNQDGIVDAVVGDYQDTYLSFMAGRGDGTLLAARVFEIQSVLAQKRQGDGLVYSVAAGNLDSDLNPDVALVDSDHNQVIVVRGKKDGTFGSTRQFQTGGGAVDLALADFDGDGQTDIVTNNNHGISVLINNGNGNFAKHVDYQGNAGALATGDVNGDGKIDVVAANASPGSIVAYLNDGAGHFNTHVDTSINNNPFSVALADINGDGKLDAVTGNFSKSGAVTVLLGNGDGSFSVGKTYALPAAAVSMVLADFNLDGKFDVALSAGFSVFVLPGNGDGTFGNYIESPLLYASGALVGDFNGDGIPDLAGTSYSVPSAEVLLIGRGDGTFYREDVGVYSSGAQAVGDFNHDGAPDLVITTASSFMTVLLNTGAK